MVFDYNVNYFLVCSRRRQWLCLCRKKTIFIVVVSRSFSPPSNRSAKLWPWRNKRTTEKKMVTAQFEDSESRLTLLRRVLNGKHLITRNNRLFAE